MTFTAIDLIAISWFLVCWIGYNRYSEGIGAEKGNLVGVMAQRRQDWMIQMLGRDNRMLDIQILRILTRSASFFASTSILVLAGLITVLGASDQAIALFRGLPFVDSVDRGQWEIKLLTMIVIFVYAFFKFGWAMRQLNYCSILIGAVGPASALTDEDHARSQNAGRIATIASKHSNRGIRAYYFGLALLTWFMHPLALILATVLVVLVLYRRESRSRILRFMGEGRNIDGAGI